MRLPELVNKRIVATAAAILIMGCAATPKDKGVAIGMTKSDVLETINRTPTLTIKNESKLSWVSG